MAYCRFTKYCNVYMYACITGGYQFHIGGPGVIDGDTDFKVHDPNEALRKLKRLHNQGKFGDLSGAIERLSKEIAESKPVVLH